MNPIGHTIPVIHLHLEGTSEHTSPADRVCNRFAICTRYARYFAFSRPTCFGSLAHSAPPHCCTVPNLAPFPRKYFHFVPAGDVLRAHRPRNSSEKPVTNDESRPVWRDRSPFPCSRHQQSSGKVGTCPSTCLGRINSSPGAESLIFALPRAGCSIFCTCVLKRGH